MSCIGFLLSGGVSSIESPLWSSGANLSLRLPLAASVGTSRSLRSVERGVLVAPFARTAPMQNRAFSVAGPRVWNDLPQELRIFPRLCTDTFPGHLKTYIFVRTGVGGASE